MKTLGFIVGVNELSKNEKNYRVLLCKVDKASKDSHSSVNWAFNFSSNVSKEEVFNLMSNKWAFVNALAEKNNIKGRAASLDRFTKSQSHPIVILSQIKRSDNGKIIGYRYATYDGKVKTARLRDIVAFGNRANKINAIPAQNAIFIPAEKDANGKVVREAHYKSYPGTPFITEVFEVNKNKYVEQRRVATKKNEKNIVKASEIFTKEQIEQLKLGKDNGVDIRIYANPELKAEQMKELRKGLEKGLNVRPFAHPDFEVMCMRYYIDCLENNIDIRQFCSSKYNYEQLFQLSLAAEQGVDISKLCNPKLSARDMDEIRERLSSKMWNTIEVDANGNWK